MSQRRLITSIASPATAGDLLLLSNFKVDYNISGSTDDTFLARAISACSAAVAQYCNRVFASENVVDTFLFSMRYNGGTPALEIGPIQLFKRPVTAIASITENGVVLVANTDYVIDSATAQIFRLDSSGNESVWANYPIVVTYTAGYTLPSTNNSPPSTLPLDITDATGRLVFARYAERGRDPFVKITTAFGIGQTEYIVPKNDGNFPPDVTDILDNYRVPVIA